MNKQLANSNWQLAEGRRDEFGLVFAFIETRFLADTQQEICSD
jgi:hypothetical protein